jgi:3'5'-cyclic nucleotide phosphodiesterase
MNTASRMESTGVRGNPVHARNGGATDCGWKGTVARAKTRDSPSLSTRLTLRCRSPSCCRGSSPRPRSSTTPTSRKPARHCTLSRSSPACTRRSFTMVRLSSSLVCRLFLHHLTSHLTSFPIHPFSNFLTGTVDHTGVPNAQLVKENAAIAEYYKNQSPAEQNSVYLAWSLLMHSDYDEIRRTIYSTEGELKRFRQHVVNSGMATSRSRVAKIPRTPRRLKRDA